MLEPKSILILPAHESPEQFSVDGCIRRQSSIGGGHLLRLGQALLHNWRRADLIANRLWLSLVDNTCNHDRITDPNRRSLPLPRYFLFGIMTHVTSKPHLPIHLSCLG